MTRIINQSGLADTFLDSNDDYEPYGCDDIGESLENIFNSIEAYKAGFSNSDELNDD